MPADFQALLVTARIAVSGHGGSIPFNDAGPVAMGDIPWAFHPSIVIGVALFVGIYLYGVFPLRRRYNWAPTVNLWQVAAFLFGNAIFFLALASPLDELSDEYMFSAHMVQHMLLILVVAPLLLVGTPGWLIRPLLRPRRIAQVARAFTNPVVAFTLFNGVFLIWHIPVFYEAALQDEGLHAVQHLMMLGTAVLSWWPVLSPLPEVGLLSYAAGMLYLFLVAQPNGALGAILTLSQTVFYPTYAEAPRLWGLSPLTDQQLGGVIMWVPGNTVYLVVLSILFFRWFGQERGEEDELPDLEEKPVLEDANRNVH